jgi:hypothetical protein
MKPICSLVLILFSASSFAQTNKFPTDGYVGIGTYNPGSELEVVGNIISRHLGNNLANASIADFNFLPSGAQYTNPVAIIKASFTGSNWYSGSKLSFFTNPGPDITATSSLERLTITSMGYVGIGTSAPASELELLGNFSSRHKGGNLPNASISDINFIPNGAQYTAPVAMIRASYSGNNWYNGTKLSFYTNPGPDITATSNLERLTIAPGGNVGIGTANPDSKLAVNGLIHAKEVKVDSDVFPDYVFEPSYELLPLEAVKTYINQEHHLPEMPTALEVKREGLNLGDINRLLVKKVEELTLYLIQQREETDKQIRAQQQQINQLNMRITKLTK